MQFHGRFEACLKDDPSDPNGPPPNSRCLYGVMEMLKGGEMFHVVEGGNGVGLRTTQTWLREMASALQHMHARGIVHRDWSLENLMLRFGAAQQPELRDRTIKVIDFGLARQVQRDPATGLVAPLNSEGPVGKRFYMAPEVHETAGGVPYPNPLQIDMWALGVAAFIMLARIPPMEIALPIDERFVMITDPNQGLQRLVDHCPSKMCSQSLF